MINIPVKIPGLERRLRTIGLMHFTAGFFFTISALRLLRTGGQNAYLPVLPLWIVAVVSIGYGAFRKKWDPASKYNFGIRMLQGLTALGYAVAGLFAKSDFGGTGFWLWVLIITALAFAEQTALQKPEVVFTDRGFDFSAGFRRKEVAWGLVSGVTLRPDFLTIHYTDNRFLQFELAAPVPERDAVQLQDFCSRHIQPPTTGQA